MSGITALTLTQKAWEEISRHAIETFPEGTRTSNGRIQEFKPTLFVLPIRTRIPVVPVLIEGTFEALRRGTALLRPVPLKITFCAPVPAYSLQDRDRSAYASKVREVLTSAFTQA